MILGCVFVCHQPRTTAFYVAPRMNRKIESKNRTDCNSSISLIFGWRVKIELTFFRYSSFACLSADVWLSTKISRTAIGVWFECGAHVHHAGRVDSLLECWRGDGVVLAEPHLLIRLDRSHVVAEHRDLCLCVAQLPACSPTVMSEHTTYTRHTRETRSNLWKGRLA